jgi:hypothetical protein
MEIADGQAETLVDGKPSVRRDHHYTRGLEGIIRREHQLPMVVATCVEIT